MLAILTLSYRARRSKNIFLTATKAGLRRLASFEGRFGDRLGDKHGRGIQLFLPITAHFRPSYGKGIAGDEVVRTQPHVHIPDAITATEPVEWTWDDVSGQQARKRTFSDPTVRRGNERRESEMTKVGG
ncbi:hypothetical protein AVEN_272966-1 [Araneus ventricosus]|uniref:Uncharacterized protein n=1 Tax=Araneus ventricosus TaxID=182803 RepID=A0A4Y2WF48_ARAVE|nr:hypothetical protein AVEN_272966-1 [Araneus ventricosus]